MRYVCPAAITAALWSILSSSSAFAQGGSGLSITNYQFVSEQRWSQTQSYVTYRADLNNAGIARIAVTASLTSLAPNVTVVPGQGNLHFSPVPASSQVTSSNTFTIFVDRSLPFSFDSLQWSFLAPVANAGPGQTAAIGSKVMLDGSGSTNPSGAGTLVYSWTFTSRPVGTGAVLFNSDTAKSYFTVDVPGNYVITLTVSNGFGSDSATVTISTTNSAPVANAGPNQTVALNALVTLNGSGSSDMDGDPLSYAWTMISRPANSAAALVGANTVSPVFVVDKPGTYIVQLIVNDGQVNSLPSTVTITTQNVQPVAMAGPNQIVTVGFLVQLNGSGSYDVNGNALTYRWAMLNVPVGSGAKLSSTTAVNPTFTADVAGTYIVQLIVNDGFADSAPATVTITTNPLLAPTANAGPNQTVAHRATVKLSGGGTDPQGLSLSFAWSMTTKPPGSNAVLLNPTTATPTFVADYPGLYVVQLIVNNGYLNSAPSTVTITTTNTPPVANAGANQVVTLSVLVTLDGSGSSDADNDPLTYSWSFMSRPTGSAATLSNPTAVSPTFVADVSGTYVVQLIVNDGFANSAPSTVTVVAGINTISLTPNPLNMAPGNTALLTVTLGTAAGGIGQTVNLATSNPSVATTLPSITIPPGLTGINVPVTAGSGTGSGTILASAPGFSPGIATVNVLVPAITLSLDAATVGITHTTNGTITLSAPAPAGGVTVTLSTDASGTVTLQPASVLINGGSVTGAFTVTGQVVGSATILAAAPGYKGGTATITVGMLGAITLPTNTTVGPGQSLSFPVKLATGAPVGGVTVTLTSTDTSTVTISPSTVFIPQLDNKPAVQPQVTGVKVGSANIVASAPGFFGDIQPVQVAATLSFSPQLLTMGVNSTQNLTLNVSGPAPVGGLTINLSSSNPAAASVPGSVTILSNTTSVVVPVTAIGLGQAVIHASALPAFPDTTASVTIVNFGPIGVPQSTSLGLGQSTPFPVTLPIAAPAGGVTITLASSDPTKVTIAPSTVSVGVGQTTPAVQPQLTGVTVGNANISATATGYSSATGAVQVTASMTFSPQNLTISGAATQNLTLTLSAAAPAGGLTVNVSSSNANVATVPSTATFAANATTVNVPVTGATPGTTVIHASGTNIPDTTANVTVQSLGTVTLPSGLTVGLTQSIPLAVTLATAAPQGGVTVTLSSSDTAKLTVSPATVNIPAGQTTPAAQPQVTGINIGTANINASAPGYTGSTVPLQVTATVSLSPQNLTINGTGTQNLTLTLSAPAPTAVTINVSSSNTGVATVPSIVTFAPNSTTVNVPVTGVTTGSAVVHASALPNIADSTANVTVQPATGVITLPSNVTVGLAQSATLPVTLAAAAPAGGVTVALSSSDTSKVTVSPATVTIQAGQTTPATQPQVTGLNFGTVTVTATATGYTAGTASVQVIGNLSFSPMNITIGANMTQNVALNLSGPAPAGGLTVNLSSSNPAVATVPATANFAANATTVNVPVTGVAGGSAVIHASNSPYLADTTANVSVQTGIVLPSNVTLEPGQSVAYPVTLSSPAPAGGIFVTLTSSDATKATLSMSSVYIIEGQTAPSAPPRLNGINYGQATITASANGYTTANGQVSVGATLTFIPASITMVGSGTENIGLNLSSFAPAGGLVVNLSSSKPGTATVPASVTIPANASSVSVPVTAVAPGSTTITATTSVPTVPSTTANVTVTLPGTIILPNNMAIGLSQSATFAVSLGSPAPAGGVTVTLASGDGTKVALSTTTVFIPQGSTSPATQPQVTGNNIGAVSITASASGYTTASATVTVNATMTFSPQSVTVAPGAIQHVVLNLSGTVPFGTGLGITVNLSSSNTAVATVPANLTFYPDGSSFMSLVVPITGVAAGTAAIHASALPYIPDVAESVTVSSPGAIILPSTVTVAPGQSAALTVTLATAAPSGGVTIMLASSDTSKVTVSPSSVTIAGGQTAPAVQPQVAGVNFGTANVMASASGYTSASSTIQVAATMSLSPQNLAIVANTTSNLLLTLSAPAPAGGLSIVLSSSNPGIATVPGSVSLGAGATTGNVPVTGVSAGSTVITASATAPNIPNATANVTVGVPAGIMLPSSVSAGLGQSTALTVTLGSPAPLGGATVSLVSSDTSKATISPATVNIDAGQTAPATQPQVTGINVGAANILASASGYTSASVPVQVTAVIGFTPASATITAGTVQSLTLTLSAPAPAGGLTVNLSSDSTSVATVPQTATFTVGTTSVNVPVTAIVLGNAGIHANLLPYIADVMASVTVQNPGGIVLPSNAGVGLGQSADFAVSLPYAAPMGGVDIALSSSDTSKVTISPSTVSIAGGQTVPATQPKVTGVGLGTANIGASAPGYASANAPVQVTATLTFSPSSLTIVGTATQNLTLTLSASAPASGLTINLSSSSPSVATVPSTVAFAGNTNTVTVPVTGVAPGSTVIHASALPNVADVAASVTVASPGTINLPPNVSVGPNQSATFAVTLGTPAPTGGVTVALNSSDTTKLTISPASVTIAGGQTTPPVQPQVTGVNFGTANINASAQGYTSASAPVQVTATLSFALQNVTISGLVTQNLTLNLSAPAPAGGVSINLLSDNMSIVTVPGTVVFAANATSVSVPVVAVALGGPVTVHASSLPNLADTSTQVTVQSAGAIGLPSNTSVGLGQSAPFAVTLPGPAPAGGVTVALASSDTSKVTISPATVNIAAGQTAPSTQPRVTGVNPGTANINASAAGYTAASAPIQVTATISFAPNSLTISGLTTQNLTLNLSAPAPSGGLSVNLSSDNPAIATVPASVSFAANATSASVPVTGAAIGGPVTIHAGAVPYIADTTASVTVQSAGTIGLPSTTTVGIGQSAAFAVTLPVAAPAGGVTVSLSSSDTSKVTISPATVTIAAGQTTPPTQPQVTGVNVGSATINASAAGYTSASAPAQVTATISFTPNTLTISGLTTQNLTLTLSGPAPAGGLTINVSSSNTAVATVPSTVNFAAAATTVSVPVTAVAIGGPVTIHASAAPGIADTTASVTVQSAGAILLPSSMSIGLGQSGAFAVTLPVAAPAGGVTVTLTSSDPSKVAVTSSVTIAAGQTTPAAQPVVNGVNLGAATIAASAPGYTSANSSVQVTASISFSPNTLVLNGLVTGNLLLTLSGAAPSGGLTVNLSSSDTTIATVPQTATFSAGATAVSIPVTAVAAGSAVIHASAAPFLADTTAGVSVVIANVGAISISSTSIGKDLQASVTLSLSAPAPSGGLMIGLTSSDPTKLLIGGNNSVNLGTASLTVSIPQGVQSAIIILQGLADNGTATVTASASGWTSGIGTVTLTPSGFVLAGPNGIGVLSIATNVGISTPMTVYSARLDSAFNFKETQQVRGGATVSNPAGLVVTVPLSSSNTSIGTVSPLSVTFNGGDTISVNITFTATGVGATTVTAGTPGGFATPVNTNSIVANVGASGLVPMNVTVGPNLETTASVGLNGAPSADVFMTISSNDATKALLSTTPTGAGSASISVKVRAGFTHTPDFYVYGVANSGTVNYTASLTGFGTATGTITLVHSGVVIAGPFGLGTSISTTSGATPTTLTLTTGTLDASGNFLTAQAVSGQGAVSVNVTSGNTGVGTITLSPVSIVSGAATGTTQFQPVGNGSTSISTSVPSGFSPAQYGSVAVTVSTAGIGITDGISIGNNLAYTGFLTLGQAPPPGGVLVTLTSNNPSQLHLATSPTDPGGTSITLNIMPPATGATYYIYALGSTGTAGYSASAVGYAGRTASAITLTPSAIVLEGSFGIGSLLFAPLSAGNTSFFVHPAQVDASGNFIQTMPLAGGQSATVSLSSSNTAVGTVPAQVTITGGSDTTTTQFSAASTGSTSVTAGTPPGFITPGPGSGGTMSVSVF